VTIDAALAAAVRPRSASRAPRDLLTPINVVAMRGPRCPHRFVRI